MSNSTELCVILMYIGIKNIYKIVHLTNLKYYFRNVVPWLYLGCNWFEGSNPWGIMNNQVSKIMLYLLFIAVYSLFYNNQGLEGKNKKIKTGLSYAFVYYL